MTEGNGRGLALDAVRRAVDETAAPGAPVTATEVAEELGCVRRTAHGKLQDLVERGDLRTKKVGARGRVWWRPGSTSAGAAGDDAGAGDAPTARDLDRQRARFAALNDLNGIVRDVTTTVIQQSTREEIESTVCERLATSESYACAWIGTLDNHSRTVTVRTAVGPDGTSTVESLPIDPDDESTIELLRAVTVDRAVRVAREGDATDATDAGEARSTAAIPIVFEGLLYGVLTVHTDRPRAFAGDERDVIAQLGGIVGHAISAVDRKRALLSDRVTELRFRIPDLLDDFDVSMPTDGTMSFEEVVPLGDGHYVEYGTVATDTIDLARELTERLPFWTDLTIRNRRGDVAQFDLHLDEPPTVSAVAANGGYIEEMIYEDNVLRKTILIPPTVDVWRIVDVIEEAYPQAELMGRRQVSHPRTRAAPLRRSLAADLTDRQRTVLDTAYRSGYFEYPRVRTGAEVAEMIGISHPTFNQHLRKAENKVVSALYSTGDWESG